MYNIIYNPRSGGGKKRRVYARVIQRLDALHAEYRVFETEKEKQALWLTRELTSEGTAPCTRC